jgi:signal transduction histidine kinase/CheY-like chemotaxis protein
VAVEAEAGRSTGRRLARLAAALLLVCAVAAAQSALPLEEVTARRASDYAPAHEGESVVVLGTVSSPPIHFLTYSHLGIQDAGGKGLVLEGTPAQFNRVRPGDHVEVRGTVEHRAGLPVVTPSSIRVYSKGPTPAPQKVSVASLRSFEHLGALVTLEARVVERGESADGEYLLVGDADRPLKVFLPASKARTSLGLTAYEVGDKVRITGLASQYCPLPPHNRFFQVLVPGESGVELVSKRWLISPELFAVPVASLIFALGVWWMRERRMTAQRNMVRMFYALGEEMTGAASPPDVLKKLSVVLPGVLGISGAHLYLYNRASKTLDRVAHGIDGQPFSQPVYPQEGALPLGAAACFRNQTLLTIPDTLRSPFFPDGRNGDQPRSIMFVPMFAETELVGVMELYNTRPAHDFSPDEKVLTQHLANQIAIALRLIEEKSVREQLSRSEKLAAIGQLISGVASELKSPLQNISQLTDSIMSSANGVSWDDLGAIAGEARNASEIVARLVSFMQPERMEARRIELNSLLRSLIQFRKQEWEARGFEVHELLCPTPVHVLGSQGQLERVFLDLLIQAEQSLAEASEKRLTIGTSVLARRVLVEIGYGVNPLKGVREPESMRESVIGVPGEGLSRGIVRSHGGEMRLVRVGEGECKLELELPVAPAQLAAEATGLRPFTCLVVEPESVAREELVTLLTNRGCRVIPASSAEEGTELVQRLRFDLVFCAIRLPGLNWVEFSERIRPQTGAFVLLSEGYDYDLSRGLLSTETHVLTKPFAETELDQLLSIIQTRMAGAETAATRGLRLIRPDKKAISY